MARARPADFDFSVRVKAHETDRKHDRENEAQQARNGDLRSALFGQH
ncbi:hypothetical protein [Methylopila jiangsuensis]|nr:hypothetical protein [Methylopila jiangsuensis]